MAMMRRLPEEREAVAAACRRLAAAGLVRGTAGNVSVRAGDEVAITPTGAVLAEVRSVDVAVVGLDGQLLDGPLRATSEADMHLAVVRAFDAGAVVHTHAPVATALSTVIDELPVVHYELLLLGGTVRVAPYATFGTPELAASAVAALEGRTAALLANHGTIAYGATLDAALHATELLEWGAEVWWRASAIGTPRVLGESEQQAVVEAAVRRGYGSTHAADGDDERQGDG
jgi:L-fuculose-phosphate aldolase